MTAFASPAEIRAAIAAVKAELSASRVPAPVSYYDRHYGRLSDLHDRSDVLRASLGKLEAEWQSRWPQDFADTVAREDAAHAAAYRASVERDLAAAEQELILAQNAPPGRFGWMHQFGIENAERNVEVARRRLESLSTAAPVADHSGASPPVILGAGAASIPQERAA